MDQENTMFFENQDESYTMIDVYLYDRFFGHKNFFYLKKGIMNILLDIMIQLMANKANWSLKNIKSFSTNPFTSG